MIGPAAYPGERLAESLLPIAEVCKRTGMSRSWIYREVKARRFPKPRKVGAASRWPESWVNVAVKKMIANGGGK